MATWTYEATWGESMNRGIPKEKSSVSFTLKRTSPASVDTSLYKLASTTGTFSSDSTVKTYTSFTLNFGGYGTSSTITSNSSQHSISGSMTGISSSILNVGTGGTSISVSVTGKSSDSYNYIFFYGTKFTFTVEVTDKYSASSISAGSVNFGSNSTVNISNPNLSELNHTVTWTINGAVTYSGSQNVSTGVSTASYLMNNSWMDSAPSSTSVQCTISCVTKRNSTTIGTTSTTITVNVPASVRPSLGAASASVLNAVSGFSGRYIQNKSGLKITLASASAGQGSTISASGFKIRMSQSESYAFTYNGLYYSIGAHVGNNYLLRKSGSNTFYISLTDARGRTSDEVSVTINVDAYTAPTISATSAYRCRSNGVADENGTYANISITASYSAISGNSLTINSQYYVSTTPGTKYTAKNNMSSGVTYTIGDGNLSASNTYYISFTITDTVGSTETLDVIVQTAAYAIHVKNGGSGVAFGKTSEVANAVEINPGWSLYYKGNAVVPVVYSTTEPTTNLSLGLVWLKPKT